MNNENSPGVKLASYLLGGFGAACADGLILMLTWGAVASWFDGPTIGYWPAVGVAVCLNMIGGWARTVERLVKGS